MTQYKLKKDLPTFKAGEKFSTNSFGDLIRVGDDEHKPIIAYAVETIKKFPNILADWFEEISEEPKSVWDLEPGDKYFILWSSGTIEPRIFSYDDYTIGAQKIGNVFLTREEAERERDWRRARVVLLQDTKGFKPNWRDNTRKYGVYFNFDDESIDVTFAFNMSGHKDLWFATLEDARKSIDKHEAEWKIYLGVED